MSPEAGYYLPQRGMVKQADQALIPRPDIPRSTFSGRAQIVTTFDAGYLIPFYVDECLPGDHFRLNTHAYVRMSTPLFPLYSEQRIDVHWWFSPPRLLSDRWRSLMGEQASPGDSIAYTVPKCTSTGNGFAVGGVGDYLGLPTVGQPTAPLAVCLWPFKMYNLVYNQHYRDENSMNAATFSNNDTSFLTEASYPLLRRAKTHDRYTSALPWAQKFTPPPALGTQAPVTGIGLAPLTAAGGGLNVLQTPSTANPTGAAAYALSVDSNAPWYMSVIQNATPEAVPQIFADLSAISVNTLRQSFMVQALLERDARGGTRYNELNFHHFGVPGQDFRLQRTEYIGGSSVPLGTTPIAQTATGGGGLGALGGATAAFGQGGVSYACQEHGYILGIISVKSELVYQQGVARMWDRNTRLDFYFPSMAQLGEQPVLTREIYALGTAADNTVFGYVPAWDEYRWMTSRATGLMRSTAAGNIDEWHTGQQFSAAPVLGATFLNDTPPMTRVLAAGAAANGMQYVANILVERSVTRPMPTHGTPASFGRF